MRFIKLLLITIIFAFSANSYAGLPNDVEDIFSNNLNFSSKHKSDGDDEYVAYYDLRNRKSYVQITRTDNDTSEPELCVHIQIFQQDLGCEDVNFNDKLTINDTVVYDMDNIVRNDGSGTNVKLADDSYGYVAISTYDCSDTLDNTEDIGNLVGNFRIIDDAGYEYRMNFLADYPDGDILNFGDKDDDSDDGDVEALPIIPFNTVDGANQADIVAFVYEDDRSISGFQGDEIDDDTDFEHLIYNETAGASFEVFLVDENEERVSCGIKNFACGPNKIMNYGINKDIPASRGDNLLCNSATLDPGQTNGYVSLERPSFVSSINNILLAESVAGVSVGGVETSFEFVCLVGLNNGNGTGSMDTCQYKCAGDDDSDCRED